LFGAFFLLQESKKRFDEDEEFNVRAHDCVVKLQSYNADFVKAWQMICDVSRKDFTRVLKLDNGRKLMFPSGCEVPLTVVKSDGGNTYDTSDLAAIKHRLDVEKADWLIYVVDAEGIYLLRSLSMAVAKSHSSLINPKKFKSRSGDTIRLTDLLDEGIRRAAAKLQEKERDKVMSPQELEEARDAIAYDFSDPMDLSFSILFVSELPGLVEKKFRA
uniref:Arginyl-tRNA synthetase catalytic core domain-containing protein n=1 Tax=Parascaris equorum TaxID=6256 RepID=A0A914R731_PAREQ